MSLITQEERDIIFPGWKRGNGIPEPYEPRPRNKHTPKQPTNRDRRRHKSSNKHSASSSNTSFKGDLTPSRHFELPIRPIKSPNGGILSVIDIGVNFPKKYYQNTDIPPYLARAAAAGVSHMIIIGTDYSTSQDALQICKKFDGCEGVMLRCTVGIHPHNATQIFEQRVKKEVYEAQLRDEKDDVERGKKKRGKLMMDTKVIRFETTKVCPKFVKSANGSSVVPSDSSTGNIGGESEVNGNGMSTPETVDQEWVILEAKHAKTFHTNLEKLITSPKGRKYCVAIGQIGLDYNGKSFNPLHQKQVFRKLLPLGSKHNIPLYLHNRNAHSDFLSILKPFLTSTKAVVHCHTDPSLKNLRELLTAGVYLGLTGIVADKRVGRFNGEIVGEIPLDRMMIETNAPFLMPRNVPKNVWGERNEACLLPFVGRKIAQIRGDCTDQKVAESTTRVAKEFFGF